MDNELLKLQELFDDGWSLWFRSDAVFVAGDCNCPYNKEFDRTDGHGYSEVIIPKDDFEDLYDLLEEAYPKCKEKVK